jgi:glycosyltransferase involved in cell wall biosynthesis
VVSRDEDKLPAIWLRGWKWHRPPDDDKHLNDIRPIFKNGSDLMILGGWDEPSYLICWLYGVLTGKKILFWVESTAYEGNRRGIRESYKKILLRLAKGCLVPGERASEYCSMLGVPKERIFVAPNSTDRAHFNMQASRLSNYRDQIREDLGIRGVTILFVGRLVEEYKNVATLIQAFKKLTAIVSPVSLIVVGDGPDRVRYESIVKETGIFGVHFLGELKHNELCRVYTAADIQVLPSRIEPWGFVLNEGMEFGLPLVVSEAVGAGPDLVHPGENGFVFPVGDSDKLGEILESLVRDEFLRKRMGQASKRIIENFTPEAWAQGVVKAIESVTGKAVSNQ